MHVLNHTHSSTDMSRLSYSQDHIELAPVILANKLSLVLAERAVTKFLLFVQQGTASEATLMSLLAARCKAVRWVQASNPKKSEAEIFSKLVAYTSEQVVTQILMESLIPLILHKFLILFE